MLDVCCANGRHAGLLAAAGYEITGIDRDAVAIAQAKLRVPAGTFEVLDQRNVASLAGGFDAAVILWQSFGYFDSATNDQVLAGIAGLLRPGGRLLLDVYHPDFVRDNVGRQAVARAPECRSIVNIVDRGRLISSIEYVDGSSETMDFELFEPDQLAARAGTYGFTPLSACCRWDGERPPSSNDQRYQLVLERGTP